MNSGEFHLWLTRMTHILKRAAMTNQHNGGFHFLEESSSKAVKILSILGKGESAPCSQVQNMVATVLSSIPSVDASYVLTMENLFSLNVTYTVPWFLEPFKKLIDAARHSAQLWQTLSKIQTLQIVLRIKRTHFFFNSSNRSQPIVLWRWLSLWKFYSTIPKVRPKFNVSLHTHLPNTQDGGHYPPKTIKLGNFAWESNSDWDSFPLDPLNLKPQFWRLCPVDLKMRQWDFAFFIHFSTV